MAITKTSLFLSKLQRNLEVRSIRSAYILKQREIRHPNCSSPKIFVRKPFAPT